MFGACPKCTFAKGCAKPCPPGLVAVTRCAAPHEARTPSAYRPPLFTLASPPLRRRRLLPLPYTQEQQDALLAPGVAPSQRELLCASP